MTVLHCKFRRMRAYVWPLLQQKQTAVRQREYTETTVIPTWNHWLKKIFSITAQPWKHWFLANRFFLK